MSPRALLLVPLALAAGGAVFALGPYGELTARLDPLRPLDEAPAATWAEAQRLFAALGPEGRELYREHFSWDLVFIAANAAAFLLLLAVPLARLGAPRWARPFTFRTVACHLATVSSIATTAIGSASRLRPTNGCVYL